MYSVFLIMIIEFLENATKHMKEDNILYIIRSPRDALGVTVLVFTLLCFYEKQTSEQQQNQKANKPWTLYK